MSRMIRLGITAIVTALVTLGAPAAAEAVQPPPRCKLLSQTREVDFVRHRDKAMLAVVTTTTSRCRGKIVTTVTWSRLLDGPR